MMTKKALKFKDSWLPQFNVMVTTIVLTLCSWSSSQADIKWIFNEVGDDVVATASGSFIETYSDNDTVNVQSNFGIFLDQNNYLRNGISNRRFAAGTYSAALVSVINLSSHIGTFGFNSGALIWGGATDSDFVGGTDVTTFNNPTATWNNTTIDAIFDNATNFDTYGDEVVLWTSNSNSQDTISFVREASLVPEPSSVLLMGLGSFALLVSRRR